MRILVCGGKNFDNYTFLASKLDAILLERGYGLDPDRPELKCPEAIILGGARGADDLADQWAVVRMYPIKTYLAQWHLHGRAAGPIRNQQMLDKGKPQLVIAFPGGAGTADMVRRARKANVEVVEVML